MKDANGTPLAAGDWVWTIPAGRGGWSELVKRQVEGPSKRGYKDVVDLKFRGRIYDRYMNACIKTTAPEDTP